MLRSASALCSGFSSICLLAFFQFRIGVASRSEIGGARPRVQFGEQPIVARLCFELCYFAIGVVDIPECNRVCRAGCLACGGYITVPDFSPLLFGFYFGAADPLYA